MEIQNWENSFACTNIQSSTPAPPTNVCSLSFSATTCTLSAVRDCLTSWEFSMLVDIVILKIQTISSLLRDINYIAIVSDCCWLIRLFHYIFLLHAVRERKISYHTVKKGYRPKYRCDIVSISFFGFNVADSIVTDCP